MLWKLRAAAAAVLALGLVAGASGPAGAKPETPVYEVVQEAEDFEIRSYATTVIAQITMRGTYKRAVSDGYIKLERYFTGENTVPERIEYTAPVMVRDDLEAGWTTIFVLPSAYRQYNAPPPNDQRIRVVELPERRVAAVKFGGKLNETVMREQMARLKAWLEAQGIAHRGDFMLASYDQSWVPSKWRGNEVLVTLK